MNTLNAIQRLRQVLRRQHEAISTESSYVYWLRQYIAALRHLPQTLSARQKLERFLTQLACKRKVSASTQNPALNALVFFYQEVLGQPIQGLDALRAKRPVTVRHAPTLPETYALLRTVSDLNGYGSAREADPLILSIPRELQRHSESTVLGILRQSKPIPRVALRCRGQVVTQT